MEPQNLNDPDILLKKAMTLHGEGKLDDAAMLYRQLLQRFPSHTDLLNVLGTLELQRGNANKAVMLLARSLGLKPAQPLALHHRAVGLQNLGRLDEALECYDKALVFDPGNVEYMQARGQVLMALNRAEEAVRVFTDLARAQPDIADHLYNLATIQLHLKRYDEALSGFSCAIALSPNTVNAYINRSTVLSRLGRPDEALADLDRALALSPDCAEAHANRGDTLRTLHRPQEALEAYRHALQLAPTDAEIHYGCGNVLYDLNRKAEALDQYNAAIGIDPRYSEAYNNRGNVQIDLDQPEEALASLDRAIALNPKNAEAFTNRGNVLRELNRPKEALISYDRAIAVNPDYAEAYANKSIALLHLGNFEDGWKNYEWRWKCLLPNKAFLNFSEHTVRHFEKSLWLGEQPLAGRRILIHAEQGLGDTVQFCRYVPMVYAAGGEVIVEAPKSLLPLLKTLKGTYEFVASTDTAPEFDLHCPMMSLPLAFATTLEHVPADVPYLSVDPARREKWQALLGPQTGSRIGIAWSGNPEHTNDRNRSIALSRLAALFALPFEFHAIQKDLRPEDGETLQSIANLRHHGDALEDFADTAALIEAMDLVISVDTSVAHVAGALGKPVWLMLTQVSEWRWLFERTDSPWYPTAELFRQNARGDWAGVLTQILTRLQALTA